MVINDSIGHALRFSLSPYTQQSGAVDQTSMYMIIAVRVGKVIFVAKLKLSSVCGVKGEQRSLEEGFQIAFFHGSSERIGSFMPAPPTSTFACLSLKMRKRVTTRLVPHVFLVLAVAERC